MNKKLFWVLGLAILLTMGFIIYWKFEWPGASRGTKSVPSKNLAENCEQAQFPFACYLDKAMAADDPALCQAAGMGKRANCLTAFAEIMGKEVDCSKLGDTGFRMECVAAFRPQPEAKQEKTTSTIPGQKDDALATSTKKQINQP